MALISSSAVQYLEGRVAELDNNPLHSILRNRHDQACSRKGLFENTEIVYNAVLQVAAEAMGSICTSSLLRNGRGIYYEARLFYSSERPPLKIPVAGVYNEEPPRLASRGSSSRVSEMGAKGIPYRVAKTLFDNYVSKILPRYPCFLKSDLVNQFDLFYMSNPEEGLSDTTWFIVSLVLAISSLTSKAHDFWKVASLSESLQRDALSRSSFLGVTSIRSLQCSLLLIQMALLLPYTSNLWYMSGEAMRMAIALGLHQESDGCLMLDSVQLNLRRSIFWTVRVTQSHADHLADVCRYTNLKEQLLSHLDVLWPSATII